MKNTDYDDIMLDFEIAVESCPVCAADAAELGGLRRLMWFRCTCCGAEFSRDIEFNTDTEFNNDGDDAEGDII